MRSISTEYKKLFIAYAEFYGVIVWSHLHKLMHMSAPQTRKNFNLLQWKNAAKICKKNRMFLLT